MHERVFIQTQTVQVFSFETELCPPPVLFLVRAGIEGGFDVEQEQYEEDVKVVILPDRQEVTSEDLVTMPDVVRERVRYLVCFMAREIKSGLSPWQYTILQYYTRYSFTISNIALS